MLPATGVGGGGGAAVCVLHFSRLTGRSINRQWVVVLRSPWRTGHPMPVCVYTADKVTIRLTGLIDVNKH